MTVGILGLGLIGGSLARAYAVAGHTVYAAEKDESILAFAQLAGAVDAPLTDETIGYYGGFTSCNCCCQSGTVESYKRTAETKYVSTKL